METTSLLFVSHLLVTGLLTGLIWVVQVEIYPGFSRMDRSLFPHYHRFHSRRISWLVVPWMPFEMFTAVALWFAAPVIYPRGWQVFGLVLIAVIWFSTALLQVPCHTRLARGFDPVIHRRLVTTNWIRTLAWSLRFVVLCGLLLTLSWR